MGRPLKTATDYRRGVALTRQVHLLRKYFPPSPAARSQEVVDVVETALRTVLPGCRARVELAPIGADTGRGAQQLDGQWDTPLPAQRERQG